MMELMFVTGLVTVASRRFASSAYAEAKRSASAEKRCFSAISATAFPRIDSPPEELRRKLRLRGQEQIPRRFSECYLIGTLRDTPSASLSVKAR